MAADDTDVGGAASGAGDAADAEGPAPDESDWDRRRIFLLLVVVFLVLVGGGAGTFVLGGDGDGSSGPQTPATDAPPGTTPTLTPTPVTPDGSGNVTFEFVDDATLVRAENVVPGQSGATQRAVRNAGTMAATLAVVNLSVTDSENGLTGPESDVDDSPGEGELSAHLLVRLTVTYGDGETATVFGGEGFVPLADVTATNESVGTGIGPGSTATLTFEYRVAETAGNEIQSDTVAFDIGFQLRAPESES